MNIRKIAVVGSFAAGAALALAPLASAEPTEITSTVDAEIASMNALFGYYTTVAGIPASEIDQATPAQPFVTIDPAFVDKVQDNGTTPFDYYVYGLNPTLAGLATDPGAYNVYNGASTEFNDAYNVFLYALLNNNALDPNMGDFFGSQSVIDSALGDHATVMSAFDTFFQAGLADLAGYFGI